VTAKTLRQWAIIGLVFILAAAIFWESWQATVAAARDGGRPTPELWPVTLEGLLAVLVLVYWAARADRRGYAWVAQVAVWLVTAAGAVVQILDAPEAWLGWITAGLTPVMLLVAVEFAVWLLYGAAVGAVGGQHDPQVRGGPPGETAASVLTRAPMAPSHGVGTPPPSSAPASVNGGHGPDTGDGNLPDRGVEVTTATVTVPSRSVATPWKPPDKAVGEALRRRRDDRERLVAYATDKGLPVDEVLALAARRGWPAANGHKEAAPV
jgi:hypothetical protein